MSMESPDTEKSLTKYKVRILLVDDQLIIVEALRRMLMGEDDIEFHFVTDAAQALQSAIEMQPTVILQDLVMPGSDGFELLRQYRAHEMLEHVPVVVLSAREDPKLKRHMLSPWAPTITSSNCRTGWKCWPASAITPAPISAACSATRLSASCARASGSWRRPISNCRGWPRWTR
jgi:CheY-like chemotaxis protein